MSDDEAPLDGLEFLLGRWVSDRFGETVEEVWTRVSSAAMMGMFCWVREGEPALVELLLLQARPTGITLALRAYEPQEGLSPGQAGRAVLWRLVRCDSGEATFEAVEHGRPSRIVYRRERADRLYAHLERHENGQARIYPYHYRAAALAPVADGAE